MIAQQIYAELFDEGTIVYCPVWARYSRDMIFKIEGNVAGSETWAFYQANLLSVNIIHLLR